MRDDDRLLSTPGLEFGSGIVGPCDVCGVRQAVIVLTKERYKLCVIDFLNKTWAASKAKPGVPLPPYRSERVRFPTDTIPSGDASAVALSPTKQVRRPCILVTAEVYGLTTSLLDAGIHFARAGFEVLLPDLGKTNLFGPGDHLATRFALRTKGAIPITSPRVGKLARYYADALAYLRTRDMVDPERSAVFGLSVGGSIAIGVAGLDQKLTALALAYPAPVTPPESLDLVTARVFFLSGSKDRSAAASRRQFGRLPAGQVEFDLASGVGTNFLSRDLRAYDQNRAEMGWAHLIAFLRRQLMPPPPKPPTPPTKPVTTTAPSVPPKVATPAAAPPSAVPTSPPATPSAA
ncbi:MAG: dienelactone hydrolase family protein [Thermoplasmata archaeon]|nr:dienelactone hydrolase family protein [Thermoplasmata archaeon]MCI4355733.1 dienelactone hydrolase family protein [Thermoplasmata archaeon]